MSVKVPLQQRDLPFKIGRAKHFTKSGNMITTYVVDKWLQAASVAAAAAAAAGRPRSLEAVQQASASTVHMSSILANIAN